MAELLRVFWSGRRGEVARAIREILRYEIPAVRKFDDQLLLQCADCTAEEEVLLLLHSSGERGLNREQLGRFVRKSPGRITQAIQHLEDQREIIRRNAGTFTLTDSGANRVIYDLAGKLQL
jgi:hypothetical protein